jgi:cytochrome c biogenesis protein CcmG/thiol:disulfide interchange protein DsbE
VKDISGKTFGLAEVRGKVVLLDFWATYCEACHKSMPVFEKMHETHAAQGLEVIGVSIDTYTGNVPEFVKQNGMKYRILLDSDSAMYKAYGIRGLPATYLLGRDGRIRRQWVGYTQETLSEIESEVKTALQ